MHDNLRWKNQTTRYILLRHWLYKWFSQFHRCGTYSVLSRSNSIVNYNAIILDFIAARTMEVVVTTGATRRAKLRQTNTQFLTGRMPFLSPNQQRQSTEGRKRHKYLIPQTWSVLTPSPAGGGMGSILCLTIKGSWLRWREGCQASHQSSGAVSRTTASLKNKTAVIGQDYKHCPHSSCNAEWLKAG